MVRYLDSLCDGYRSGVIKVQFCIVAPWLSELVHRFSTSLFQTRGFNKNVFEDRHEVLALDDISGHVFHS